MQNHTKCGGSHHGQDDLDVYVTRHTSAPSNQSRYQICDLTSRTQHFCRNPVEARNVVTELKAAGHTLRKNPVIMDRPYGQTTAPLPGKPRSAHASPAAVKMVQDLFNGKTKGANVGIEITITVNGKPIKIM